MLKAQLDAYDAQRAELKKSVQPADPVIVYNRQLLSKYESALAAFGQEMAKYEDKPGDVNKSMQELEKNLEKAKKGQ
jgi:chromosome segregation ATPase